MNIEELIEKNELELTGIYKEIDKKKINKKKEKRNEYIIVISKIIAHLCFR